jgi:hypothetical protein
VNNVIGRVIVRPFQCLSNEQVREAKAFVEAEMDGMLQLPCVRRVKADRLGLLLIAAGSTRSLGVAAIYVPSRHEILIAEDLDLDDPVGASFIVHELVHVVQIAEGRHLHMRCPGQLEYEAYSKQALFLERQGHSQMALLMRIAGMMQAACGTAY